jgi:Cysteine-rich secretory protein family
MSAGGDRRRECAGTSTRKRPALLPDRQRTFSRLGAIPLSMMRRHAILVSAGIVCAFLTTTAVALDLNSYRAQHGLRPLSSSGALAGAASSHAHNLAARQRLDHSGFRQRVSVANGTAAENVAFGCATEDCVIRMWSRSSRHRANMLRRDVTLYGLASADGGNGRRYWVLELGN